MKKYIIKAIVTASIIASSSSAFAFAHTGVSISAQMGYAAADIHVKGSNNVSHSNSSNFFYGGTIGYDFAITPLASLGIETGLLYSRGLAKINIKNDSNQVNNLIVPLFAKGTVYVPFLFNIFAKAGIAYTKVSSGKGSKKFDMNFKNKYNFAAAAGIGYQLFNANLFVQYMHIFGKNDLTFMGNNGNGTASKVDAITAGATFTF